MRVWDYFMRRKGLLLLLVLASIAGGFFSSHFSETAPDATENIPTETQALTIDSQNTLPSDAETNPVDTPLTPEPTATSVESENPAPVETSFVALPESAPERLRLQITNPTPEQLAESLNSSSEQSDLAAAASAFEAPEIPLTNRPDPTEIVATWQDIARSTTLALLGAAALLATIRLFLRR